MPKDAPHLPNNIMTDSQKKQWHRLKFFFMSLLFCLFVSFVTAIMVMSWIMPQQSIQQTTSFIVNKKVNVYNNESPLSQLVLSQSQQRIVSVYNKQGKVNDLYRADAFIGHALLLSAGGWAVMYAPDNEVSSRNWELLDFQGNTYRVLAVQVDPYIKGLTYLQINGDNFRGDSQFTIWNSLQEGSILVALSNKLQALPVAIESIEQFIPNNSQYNLADITYNYQLVGDTNKGNIIITDTGAFVGFVNDSKQLVPGWYVQTQLTALLEAGKVNDSVIGNQGFLVRNAVGDHPGFYVATGGRVGTSSTLAVGDIVTKINNRFLDELDIAEHVILAQDILTVEVIRNEEKVSLRLLKR